MTFWKRLRRLPPVRVLSRYLDRAGPNQATLIAWNLLFAFFPITVLAVTVAGLLFQNHNAGHAIATAVASVLPGGHDSQVLAALDAFHRNSGLLAAVGIVGLLWSGSSLFSAMEGAFATLGDGRRRGFIAGKLVAIGMSVLFTLLAAPVVLSSSLLAGLGSLPGLPSWLDQGAVAAGLQVVVSVFLGSLLFAAIYGLVPSRRAGARSVALGAVVAGVLFEALSLLFPLYFRLAHGFSNYGSTFSLFFVILAYAFLLAQITVLGYSTVAEFAPPAAAPPEQPEALPVAAEHP